MFVPHEPATVFLRAEYDIKLKLQPLLNELINDNPGRLLDSHGPDFRTWISFEVLS